MMFSQTNWDDLTGSEKAFLYHTTRRTEILKSELFHLFEFTDSIPYINDTLPDYRYIEKEIVKNPLTLTLHSSDMRRKSDGVVADLAVRYALWELDQILHYRNSTAEEDKPLKEKLKNFEQYVLEKAPQNAVRTLNNGDYVLLESLQGYYAPSLTIADKLAAIVNAGYEQIDQMLILNAIMFAEEKYVQNRATEIYHLLRDDDHDFGKSFISAVGDGSNWAEIVGGINTPYGVGLPDEKGLFRFIIEEKEDEEKEKVFLEVKPVEQKQLVTQTNENTVVHVDVFGYHEERQTTLSIQKGGNAYVLYGKNEHRLVSPDSTYGEGVTYWRLMNRLEHFYIANLKEDLYGKRGYEYQIDQVEKKIEITKLQIKKTEYRLDVLRHTPEGKPKIKKKKNKKKNMGFSDQAGSGHPTSKLSKLDKKKNIEQNRLVQLNNLLSGQKTLLAQLKEDMEKAHETLIKYEALLDLMKKTMGYIIMEFEQENHIYRFKDGATFNYLTQDFTFPANGRSESFFINHISFGKELFTDKIDENFIHINVSSHNAEDKYSLKRIVRDNRRVTFTKSDSVQVVELFANLARDGVKANLTVYAGGIIGGTGNNYFRDSTLTAEEYNKDEETNFGLVEYKANFESDIALSVRVFDDKMKPANFGQYESAFAKANQKYPELTAIDFYSGIRAKEKAELWIEELKRLANLWIKDSEKKKEVLGALKKLKVKKVQFINGKYALKVPSAS